MARHMLLLCPPGSVRCSPDRVADRSQPYSECFKCQWLKIHWSREDLWIARFPPVSLTPAEPLATASDKFLEVVRDLRLRYRTN